MLNIFISNVTSIDDNDFIGKYMWRLEHRRRFLLLFVTKGPFTLHLHDLQRCQSAFFCLNFIHLLLSGLQIGGIRYLSFLSVQLLFTEYDSIHATEID